MIIIKIGGGERINIRGVIEDLARLKYSTALYSQLKNH